MDPTPAFSASPEKRIDRRRLLQLGGLSLLGWNIAGILHAARAIRSPSRIKSCVLLYYYGGPSHLDTWDMKPDAPAEIRGEFRPIATSVPGIRVCEHMPHCARVMDRLAVVRSLHHRMRNHNAAAVEALCGRTPLKGDLELLADDPNSYPCYGSILSYALPRRGDVPAHVALPHVMTNIVTLPGQNAGFLGTAHNPFQVTRDPNLPGLCADALELPADVPSQRLTQRRTLLDHVDTRTVTGTRTPIGKMNVNRERAFELIYSEKVRRAFDLGQEPDALRERYGRNKLGQSLLLARRLVETGVRFINVNDKVRNGQITNWDSHENNFGRLKNDLLPPSDRAFATFIEDLASRGLLDTTLVIALAEFGRSPKINGSAGRDHWPDCFSVVLAGGGVRGGAIHGASDSRGAYPASEPVTPGDLAATIFWAFGLDPEAEMRDIIGRPYRLAEGQPLRKLFS
jgi:hypothetical protein